MGAVLAVVHEPLGTQAWSPLVFELCALARTDAGAVAARVAERHRMYDVDLDDMADDIPDAGGLGRHLLRLTPRGPADPGGALTDDLLADLLAPPAAGTIAVTGHQRALLAAAVDSRCGPGRYVEQIFWDWAGPLDLSRFITAWQSVAEREAVLRASFDWAGAARLVLHDRAVVEVVRHAHADVAWSELLRQDRARGFELYRPGLLRLSLLDGPPDTTGAGHSPTRLLVTYHRALLDERGARLLVRQFYRAYLAGGVLPGGDRRPDIRDHTQWLTRQDPAGAREFWASAAPPADAAVSPGRPGGPLRHTEGPGRIQRRLRPPETSRLRSWAAGRGAGESSALHAVWALLLYRAAGADGPLPVAFGVHLSGRDMSLRAAADIPGLLGNPLPMTVTVDPSAALVDLLLQARNAALDLCPYAWVSNDRIREWSGRACGPDLTETTVRFDSHPELPQNLRAELAARGIRVGVPQSAGGDTTLPVTLVAHYDADGALVLTALYDRARFTDTDASSTLSQCLQLLRRLPEHPDEGFTVGDALRLLSTSEVPRLAPPEPGGTRLALAVLRAGAPGADVVCLVTVPGVTPGAYDTLVREHEGPERIVSLSVTGRQVPSGPLRELLGGGRRLTLCGAGPAARVAHEIARSAAERTGEAWAVVMTGVGGAAESAEALSRALQAVRARST
ncbi:condensation domain-containing protein [Streptomyces sp. TLI_185]|uniref:condensation domain-containing protein n=1 Tax=Streptomyces sp. TLI_185 TaxID=2485151 RepID=UPI000FBE838B|nr:condensation domain-containing protein [Streptomyces sp. TLI_185]RPF24796.1 condensation domain-containing protein [Streptomyces sp. TLI_185]